MGITGNVPLEPMLCVPIHTPGLGFFFTARFVLLWDPASSLVDMASRMLGGCHVLIAAMTLLYHQCIGLGLCW